MGRAATVVTHSLTINCDMGEGFGRYSLADDEAIMPLIDLANIACGFHASDPVIMRRTVRLAAKHGVAIGAHPSLPDLQGFGRRAMKISRGELSAILMYQIGALKAFIDAEGAELSHIKPHGALYGMAFREAEIAHAICDAAEPFGVPLFGLAGTLQETVYASRGIELVAEFYADLPYDNTGHIVVGLKPPEVEPDKAAERAICAIREGWVESTSRQNVAVRATSICVHSDSGNAVEVIEAIRTRVAKDDSAAMLHA